MRWSSGSSTSCSARTFSWSKWRSSLISRSTSRACTASSKARATFLIATASPVVVSRAAQISPYAPCPITLVSSYRFGATNVRPERSYVRDVSDTSGAGRGGDGMVAAAAASAVCCSRTWRSRSFAA